VGYALFFLTFDLIVPIRRDAADAIALFRATRPIRSQFKCSFNSACVASALALANAGSIH
jgi:hypothetical protein